MQIENGRHRPTADREWQNDEFEITEIMNEHATNIDRIASGESYFADCKNYFADCKKWFSRCKIYFADDKNYFANCKTQICNELDEMMIIYIIDRDCMECAKQGKILWDISKT